MNHKFRNWWDQSRPKWWGSAPPPAEPIKPPAPALPMKISASVVEFFRNKRRVTSGTTPYAMPTYAPGVLPNGASKLAMDEEPTGIGAVYGYGNGFALNEGLAFIGYPALAELTQRPEYRLPSEVMAEEMTRKFIVIKARGNGDKTKRIEELTEAMKVFKLREVFRDATELDSFMGLAFIHIDLGTSDDPGELATRLILDKAKIAKGSLKGFTVVDPLWCAPSTYNSANPLMPDFYRPQLWYVMGVMVHVTRLLPIVSRPVPDILKPAYNFGGLSLSQMLMPYVRNWLRTRQSVSDLLNAFTVFTLETNMQATLQAGGPADMDARLNIFASMRDNLGLMAIDKETEALSNVSAPLGTLDKLQAQTQEHMAAVAREPFTKLFGITPTGLNATTDGEERSFYDTIHGRQERVYTDPLTICLKVIQLHLWDEIDPELYFEFLPLWELDEAGKAAVEKTKADVDAVLMETGVISNEEARERISRDHASPYHGLTGPAPEVPELGDPDLSDPTEQIDKQAENDSTSGANAADAAMDETFNESDHPRDKDGRFGATAEGAAAGKSHHEQKQAEYEQSHKEGNFSHANIARSHMEISSTYGAMGLQISRGNAAKVKQFHERLPRQYKELAKLEKASGEIKARTERPEAGPATQHDIGNALGRAASRSSNGASEAQVTYLASLIHKGPNAQGDYNDWLLDTSASLSKSEASALIKQYGGTND